MRIEEFELILDDIGSSIKYKKDYKYFLGQRLRWIGNFKVLKEYLNKKDKILEVGSFPSYFLATLKEGGYIFYYYPISKTELKKSMLYIMAIVSTS